MLYIHDIIQNSLMHDELFFISNHQMGTVKVSHVGYTPYFQNY